MVSQQVLRSAQRVGDVAKSLARQRKEEGRRLNGRQVGQETQEVERVKTEADIKREVESNETYQNIDKTINKTETVVSQLQSEINRLEVGRQEAISRNDSQYANRINDEIQGIKQVLEPIKSNLNQYKEAKSYVANVVSSGQSADFKDINKYVSESYIPYEQATSYAYSSSKSSRVEREGSDKLNKALSEFKSVTGKTLTPTTQISVTEASKLSPSTQKALGIKITESKSSGLPEGAIGSKAGGGYIYPEGYGMSREVVNMSKPSKVESIQLKTIGEIGKRIDAIKQANTYGQIFKGAVYGYDKDKPVISDKTKSVAVSIVSNLIPERTKRTTRTIVKGLELTSKQVTKQELALKNLPYTPENIAAQKELRKQAGKSVAPDVQFLSFGLMASPSAITRPTVGLLTKEAIQSTKAGEVQSNSFFIRELKPTTSEGTTPAINLIKTYTKNQKGNVREYLSVAVSNTYTTGNKFVSPTLSLTKEIGKRTKSFFSASLEGGTVEKIPAILNVKGVKTPTELNIIKSLGQSGKAEFSASEGYAIDNLLVGSSKDFIKGQKPTPKDDITNAFFGILREAKTEKGRTEFLQTGSKKSSDTFLKGLYQDNKAVELQSQISNIQKSIKTSINSKTIQPKTIQQGKVPTSSSKTGGIALYTLPTTNDYGKFGVVSGVSSGNDRSTFDISNLLGSDFSSGRSKGLLSFEKPTSALTGSVINERPRQTELNTPKTNVKPLILETTKENPRTLLKTPQRPQQKDFQITTSKINTKTLELPKVIQTPRERQIIREEIKVTPQLKTPQLTVPRTPTRLKPRTPIRPIKLKLPSLPKRLSGALETNPELFEIFVTKGGEDISAGKSRTKEEAERILKTQLKETLRAGGFLSKGGQKLKATELKGFGGGEFRLSKVNPYKIIQKKESRLGTRPETKEIQMFKKTNKKNRNSLGF